MFDFGNHLRMLREKHGISQEELGRRVGRAGSVISNYENNIKIPTLDVLTTCLLYTSPSPRDRG